MKNRTIVLGILILLACGVQTVYSQVDFIPIATIVAADSSGSEVIPASLRNNRYYLESVRLTKLAQESYEIGDYDMSAAYAEEALRYAQLSDEWVALQLKIRATNEAIAAAKSRIAYADSIGAAGIYPTEYGNAQQSYGEAVNYRSAEDWDNAIAAAKRVIDFLAYIKAPESKPQVVESKPEPKPSLPARYTVRTWEESRDCLWNIAGRSWAYGDPYRWRTLYNANKTKLRDPNNPDIIEPGMVLDIPSIQGEYRDGLWDANKTYDPLN
jgi:tetratricopeptide (TPR) repeat protein